MSREPNNSHSDGTESEDADSERVNSDSANSKAPTTGGSASALASGHGGPSIASRVPGWLPSIAQGDTAERRSTHGYSCPYRKRNPDRFNEQDYPDCALAGFEDMEDLLCHIKFTHARKFTFCFRCRQDFRTEDALRAHIRREDWCEISHRDLDVEDGIGDGVLEDDVLAWDELWTRLFPDQEDTNQPRSPAFREPGSSTADTDMGEADGEDRNMDSDMEPTWKTEDWKT
ncbi:hypothetical protein BR93DRAFT_979261 [Coniochaeta sp. PMI_546]|nr:hypothetical protein BR93DRAFT_979261 [Coniochaeta sp. PMI_546]